MKLKKTRKERECVNCKKKINKGDLYGQKSKSIPMQQTCWSIDQRPKEEIPEWAWETVYLRETFDWCKLCGTESILGGVR
tara:strand:- start:18 stop:257 length:240 start_codon:yes stop_codon:yes gene_type:complete